MPPRRPGERDCIHDLTPESGHSMVLFALLLVILLGMAALAIDGSNAYLQQQRMQIAADAAALAGARTLSLRGTNTQVTQVVNEFAGLNGATGSSWRFTTGNRGLTVEAWRTFPTFFGGVLGQPEITVSAEAEVRFVPISGASNMLPMIIDCQTNYTFGVVYEIFDQGSAGGSGGFGWLRWRQSDSGNTGNLVTNIRNPDRSGAWNIDDWVYGSPGVSFSSDVQAALSIWMNRPVTIPLYSRITGSGNNLRYQICGFGQFELLGIRAQGSSTVITGRFVQTLRAGGTGDPNAPDRGVYTLVMTR